MRGISHLSSIVLSKLFLTCIIVMTTGISVSALHMTKMPQDLQTTVADPQKRQISLKLPLRQPVFHWTFMSKEEYLEGKLILRIKRGDKTTAITIFENGKITKGWKPTPVPKNPPDQYLREAMIGTLDEKDVLFDFMIQFQTDAHKMPVEDASVLWPEKLSPFIKVAEIRIPAQKFTIRGQDDFARSLSFNPWHSIAEHRPLGNQNRARKHIYLETSRFRQQIGGDPRIEPTGDEVFEN